MAVNWGQNPYQQRPITPFYSPDDYQEQPGIGGNGSQWTGGVGSQDQSITPDVGSMFAPMAGPEAATMLQQQPDTQQDNAAYPTEEAIARRRKLAEALMGQQQEVHHPMQAIANAVSQITGSYINYKADKEEAAAQERRRKYIQDSMAGDNPNMDAIMQSWMKSGDPDLVDKAMQYRLKQISDQNNGANAPETRNFYEGDSVVTKQWDPKARQWVATGPGAPRWRERAPRGDLSGGDASFDNEGGGASDPYTIDDETLTFMAQQYLAGDKSVMVNLGRGKIGVRNIIAMRKKIRELSMQVDPVTGKPAYDPRRVAAADKDLQGYGASVRTSEAAGAKQGQAAYEARNMAGDVIGFSKRVPRSNLRFLAWVENEFRAQTGDPDIVAFAAALNSYINTYGRAISPAGVPTVSDKEHARQILSTAMSQGQIEKGIAVLDREMQNAIAAPYQQRDARRGAQYGDQSAPEHAPPLDQDPRFDNKQVGGGGGAPQRPVLKPVSQRRKGDTMDYNGSTYVWTGTGWVPR